MRKYATALVLASALVATVAAAPLLYAETPSGSMMERGMMGRNGGMMGMMDMMNMGKMMDHCSNMMSKSRPNDQWRKKAPAEPEKKG